MKTVNLKLYLIMAENSQFTFPGSFFINVFFSSLDSALRIFLSSRFFSNLSTSLIGLVRRRPKFRNELCFDDE